MAMEVSSKNNINSSITIANKQLDTNSTSLNLPGNLYRDWGVVVNSNLYWLLENFAGNVSPSAPSIGQLWYDTQSNTIKVYSSAGWKNASINFQTLSALPSADSYFPGDIVFVENSGERSFYINNNATSWKFITNFVVSSATPTTAENGTIWFDTNTNDLKIYANGTFYTVTGGGGSTSLTVNNHTTIDGKDIFVIKLGTNVVAIFSYTTVTSSNLGTFDGINLSTLFPDGIKSGLNFSNIANNLLFNSTSDINIGNRDTGTLKFLSNDQETISITQSTTQIKNDLVVSGKTTIANSVDINSTSSIKIPVGNNSQRPSPPFTGMVRFNTDSGKIEFYDGSNWIEIATTVDFSIQTSEPTTFNIVSDSSITYPHGLPAKPKMYFTYAKCSVSANGYVPGDEILLAHQTDFDEGSGASRDFFATWANNTHIGFSLKGVLRAPKKDGTGFFTLVSPNFVLLFRWIP